MNSATRLLVACALGGSITALSSGAILKVGTCDHGTYPTIGAAVAVANSGDQIQVCPGLYPENVVITIPLTLKGTGPDPTVRTANTAKESVIAPAAGVAVDIEADGVVLDGFTVEEAHGSEGIHTSDSHSGYAIRNCRLDVDPDNGVGIALNSADGTESVIEHNYFNGNGDQPGANNTDGIFSNVGLHHVVIRHNTFADTIDGGGIVFISTIGTISDVTVEFNKSTHDDSFIALFNAPGTVVANNDIARSRGSCIFIGGGNDGVVISRNKVSDCAFDGIQTSLAFGGPASSDLQISDNDVRNAGRNGIYASGASGATMLNSLLSNNRANNSLNDGIKMGPGNTNNTIVRNTMMGNDNFDAEDQAGSNDWIKNHCKTSSPSGLCN